MKESCVLLCGKDREYLNRLCDYLQVHRVMRSRYCICEPFELSDLMERFHITFLVLEGSESKLLVEQFFAIVPLLWLTEEPSVKKTNALEKYQSAKRIGERIQEIYYGWNRIKTPQNHVVGIMELGVADGLKNLCEWLRERKERALIVNLEFFTPFPGQDNLKYMSLSDFISYKESDIYREEFPPFEMEDGIYGIQVPNCLEDCEVLGRIETISFLQEFAEKLNVGQIYLYFGKDMVSWFSMAYHCHEIIVLTDSDDYFKKEWFLSYWKRKADNAKISWGLEDIYDTP